MKQATLVLLLILSASYANAQIPTLPLNTTVSCPGVPGARMSGSDISGSLPVTGMGGDEPIRSLAVRITTSSDLLSGTQDDVWLDIGPKAWKISDDFHRGSTKTIAIDLAGKDDNLDIPEVVQLYVRDISEVRLEKKGLCGLTDAPDSVVAAGLPPLPTPANLIKSLQEQVALAKYALDQAQGLIGIQQKIIDQQLGLINSAQQVVSSAENSIATIPGQIANVQNQIVDIQAKVAGTPAKIANNVCQNIAVKVGNCVFNPIGCITHTNVCNIVEAVNPVYQNLVNGAASLEKSKNDLQAELNAAPVRKAAALQSIAVATATKSAAELEKKKDEIQYNAAHTALDQAQSALDDAEALAKKLPLGDLSLPSPGQWKVDKVTLIVNGHDFANFDVGDTLKQRHSSWSRTLQSIAPDEQFVMGLRVNVNKASTVMDERLARVTTLFKLSDISGWQGTPVPNARIVGKLVNPPSPGDDGFVSLDLEVERVEVNNHAFVLDDRHEIRHKRFIRVEYKNRDANGNVDDRYKSWNVGNRFIVDAPTAWDTDRDGFYELHPEKREQVTLLKPGESGATSGIVLWWRRAFK